MSHYFSKTDPKDAFLVAKNALEGHYDFSALLLLKSTSYLNSASLTTN
jgi:hypothetical protein